jgi:queuine/archaeosine tRNA-ribosyltransferase
VQQDWDAAHHQMPLQEEWLQVAAEQAQHSQISKFMERSHTTMSRSFQRLTAISAQMLHIPIQLSTEPFLPTQVGQSTVKVRQRGRCPLQSCQIEHIAR